MSWLWLALACAFLVALADALSKRHLAGYAGWEMGVVRFGVAGLLMLPWVALHPPTIPPAVFWGWMALLLPLELTALLLYVTAIRDHPLSLTLPYLAFTPVFATVTGFLLLGEIVSPRGLAGILLVVLGAYLLNVAPENGRGVLAPLKAIARDRGARLMLGVSFIYGFTAVIGKGALQYMPASQFGPFYFALLGIATLLVFTAAKGGVARVLARQPGWHLAIGVVMAAMCITHFLALEQVETAYMLTVKRTSLLFGMVFGAYWFAERGLVKNLVAGSLMVLGVALVAL